VNPADRLEPCPSCGAPLGGRAGCQQAFDTLIAAAWQDPTRAAWHNLMVDAYCMQHPEEYGKSAKSYVQHLTALCCAIEHPGDLQLYWNIAPTFEHSPPPSKPALLEQRGELTIADLAGVGGDAYAARAREWAATVWRAYHSQRAIATDRLALAQRHSKPRGR
jgi:hypothetical protein